MEVVDTTVFAYALLGEPSYKDEAFAVLAEARQIAVPDLFRAEFANVVWKWVQAKRLPADEGLTTLVSCEPLLTTVVNGGELWEPALLLSISHAHPVYDALYVALARQLGTKVITYDKRFIAKFPEDTISPSAFLGA
jgi:predicted nucleic acid-binding protein